MDKPARKPRDWHRASYIWSIIINVIIFYVVNYLINWQYPFIRPGFDALLFFFSISLIVHVVCDMLLIAYDEDYFRDILKIITDIIGLMVIYMALTIFPFDFGWFNVWLKIAFIIAIIAIVISLIVKIVRLIAKA